MAAAVAAGVTAVAVVVVVGGSAGAGVTVVVGAGAVTTGTGAEIGAGAGALCSRESSLQTEKKMVRKIFKKTFSLPYFSLFVSITFSTSILILSRNRDVSSM